MSQEEASKDLDDDLYGDLEDTQVAVATVSTKKRKTPPQPFPPLFATSSMDDGAVGAAVASSSSAALSLSSRQSKTVSITDELEQAKLKVQQLEQENQVLRRNIGTLFRTATNEIKRKDDQISRLRTELDSAPSNQS